MQSVDRFNPGAFRAGDSYLHLLDSRLKLLLLLGLIACLFSATSPLRLLLLFALWSAGAIFCANALRDSWRVVRLLRWLLLFTLLLHLFFTPGRTLLGTSWLSLDGLLRGLLVDAQMVLAVFFSLLLAWTTKPERLVWGMTGLLAPLQRFRLPVREAGGLLLLVLQFFPLIREEVAQLQAENSLADEHWLGRIRQRAALVRPLLLRLVDRADRLAVELAAGKQSDLNEEPAEDRRLSRFDWFFFYCGLLMLLLLWMV